MAHPRKTALITGASVGIGLELARQFARGGYDLLLVARDEARLRAACDECRGLGAAADFVTADLADPAAPRAVYAQAADRGLSIDALVNNAGFGALGAFHEVDLRRQLDMIQVNVAALVELTHLFLPGMVARQSGGVLNVASTAAFQAGPLMAIYYATKAFVLSFSEAIADELKGAGVRVTALCPGPTHSEFRARSKQAGVTEERKRNRLIPTMTAEAVARAGFRAFGRGARVVVPGVLNKLAVQSTRVGSRKLVTRIAHKINRGK